MKIMVIGMVFACVIGTIVAIKVIGAFASITVALNQAVSF